MSLTSRQPHLLLIEDDPDTAEIMREALTDHLGDGTITIVNTIEGATQVDLAEIDLVLSDYNLPDGTALDVLARLMGPEVDLPVIIVTGQNQVDLAVRAIHAGAADFIVKSHDFWMLLPLIVEKNLAVWRIKLDNQRLQHEVENSMMQVEASNAQLSEMVARLKEMALTDALTGLANRRRLNELMSQLFAEAARYDSDLVCVIIDLDGFKHLNDTEGHLAGDDVLAMAGEVIGACSRESDVAARFGGDEFVILMPRTSDRHAINLADRVRTEFDTAKRRLAFDTDSLTMSMGVASLRVSHPTNGSQLLAHADTALYAAKGAGKACTMFCQADGSTTNAVQALRLRA